MSDGIQIGQSGLKVPGREDPTNNPLLVLASAMEGISAQLGQIAKNTEREPDLPHVYAVTVNDSRNQGRVWGAFCLSCTHASGNFTWPCEYAPDEPLKPPPFFTVDKAFEARADGNLVQTNAAHPQAKEPSSSLHSVPPSDTADGS